ncbi:ATP phosphoribosyltransferase, partial [Trifolium medium]|nr:ATP phosphoribosyltransferase [Trifolium medium]
MLTIMSQIGFPLYVNNSGRRRSYCCYASASISDPQVLNGNTLSSSSRKEIRLGLPSKGRMSSDTLELLKDCQ